MLELLRHYIREANAAAVAGNPTVKHESMAWALAVFKTLDESLCKGTAAVPSDWVASGGHFPS